MSSRVRRYEVVLLARAEERESPEGREREER